LKQTSFTIRTNGPGLYELTDRVVNWAEGQADMGLLTLFLRHTSASLLIQENADPAVQTDLMAYLNRLIPDANDPSMAFVKHRQEGPDDMPAHIKAAVLPVSLQIPVMQGKLALGVWQGIYLFEHRTQSRDREVVAHFA
jgi:secondary thiamine-phosphate synthase enzyme